MKYYSKLKLFKNSTGSNVIKDNVGYSYEWYRYAEAIPSLGLYFIARKANGSGYSPTTSKHISEFHKVAGYGEHIDVWAPNGLQALTTEEVEFRLREIDTVAAKRKLVRALEIERKLLLGSLSYLYQVDITNEGLSLSPYGIFNGKHSLYNTESI